jgi:hypothetical protein
VLPDGGYTAILLKYSVKQNMKAVVLLPVRANISGKIAEFSKIFIKKIVLKLLKLKETLCFMLIAYKRLKLRKISGILSKFESGMFAQDSGIFLLNWRRSLFRTWQHWSAVSDLRKCSRSEVPTSVGKLNNISKALKQLTLTFKQLIF